VTDAVLIYADSTRSPEQRHEVPLTIPDDFLYASVNGRRLVVVTSFEVDRIRALDSGLEVLPLEEFGWDEMIREGRTRAEMDLEHVRRACDRFGIRAAVVPGGFPLELADYLRAHGIEVKADRAHFAARRRVKREAELAGIRRAQRGAEAGMRAGAELLRRAEPAGDRVVLDGEPLTCERLKVAVEEAFSEHAVSAEAFIVAHGEQTAVGHEMGSGPIRPNEPVIFDLYPRDRDSGCYADMTRTFVVGEPPAELLEYQRLCHEALQRSIALIEPGVKGREVYTAVCELFHEHGYPTALSKKEGEVLKSGFYHGLGHGIGLEVHEEPHLARYPGELVAGDVVALEPGLYRPGFGGCRLEDLVHVTDDGAEVLTDYPYDLSP
jgi:Xaa-Pro aminopeptidase